MLRNLLNLICLVYYGSKIGFIQNKIEDGKDDPILIWKIYLGTSSKKNDNISGLHIKETYALNGNSS